MESCVERFHAAGSNTCTLPHHHKRILQAYVSRTSKHHLWAIVLVMSVSLASAATPSFSVDETVSSATLCRSVVLPERSVLEEIVQNPNIFDSEEEEEICRRMVTEELSVEDQAVAARTSYAYWAWEQLTAASADQPCSKDENNTTGTLVVDEDEKHSTRIRMAMREARRHYIGEGRTYERARDRLKNTVLWRKEENIDLIKSCFSVSSNDQAEMYSLTTISIWLSEKEADYCAHLERIVEAELNVQKMAVRGHDKENRAIIVKLGRESPWSGDETASEGYKMAQLYIAERAIAVTELQSMGENEKLTAMLDFGTYDKANAPPMNVMIDTIKVLQAHYPERLGKAMTIAAPFFMQAIFKVITPFLSPNTRERVSVLGSKPLNIAGLWRASSSPEELRDKRLNAVVDAEQAMPFMLSNAKLTPTIDVHQQIRQVPFFRYYDHSSVRAQPAVSGTSSAQYL